jgi:hypothetical protein
MSTIQEYWREVRALEATLSEKYPEGVLFINPTNDKRKNSAGGEAVQCTVTIAARNIVEGKATEATEAEVAIYHRRGVDNMRRSDAQTLRSFGLTKLVIGKSDE